MWERNVKVVHFEVVGYYTTEKNGAMIPCKSLGGKKRRKLTCEQKKHGVVVASNKLLQIQHVSFSYYNKS